MQTIFIERTDITKLTDIDVIVNAANETLLGGGGVDGAIHRAAGKGLLEECKTLGGCQTAEVKLTGAYNLPFKGIIHTVGPIWNDKLSVKQQEEKTQQLYDCYKNALVLAGRHKFESIAFPSISTGLYKFPIDKADYIALQAVKDYFVKNPESTIKTVKLVFFRKADMAQIKAAVEKFKEIQELDVWLCEGSNILKW